MIFDIIPADGERHESLEQNQKLKNACCCLCKTHFIKNQQPSYIKCSYERPDK